jgi:hypothetical protein
MKNNKRSDADSKAALEAAMYPESFGPVPKEEEAPRGGTRAVSVRALLGALDGKKK